MQLALYSPEDVIILLGGVYQIEGLHEGSFVSISEDDNRWETAVTADGRVTRTHNNTPIHTVSLTLASTANSNNVLSSLASLDGLLYGAMLPLFLKDANGTTLFYSPLVWVEKVPSASFGVEVEGREWIIKAAGATSIIGGNESGGLIDANLAALGMVAADFAGIL